MKIISNLSDMELRFVKIASNYKLETYITKLGFDSFKQNSIFTIPISVLLGYFT